MNEKIKHERKKNNSGASYQQRAETKRGGVDLELRVTKKNR